MKAPNRINIVIVDGVVYDIFADRPDELSIFVLSTTHAGNGEAKPEKAQPMAEIERDYNNGERIKFNRAREVGATP